MEQREDSEGFYKDSIFDQKNIHSSVGKITYLEKNIKNIRTEKTLPGDASGVKG